MSSKQYVALVIATLLMMVACYSARAQFAGMLLKSGGGAVSCAPFRNYGTPPLRMYGTPPLTIRC